MSKITQLRSGASAKIPTRQGDKFKIPDDSVGTNQLRDRSVTPSKITNVNTQVVDTDYQLLLTDSLALADTGTHNLDITVTLPDATTCKGQQFTIKKIESSTNPKYVRVGTLLSQTIDLQVSGDFYLTCAADSYTLQSDGANWKVVDQYVCPVWGYRYKGANQSVPNNSITLAALDGGQGSQVSFVSNGRIDILFDAYYDISANAQWVSNGAGSRGILVYLNGSVFSGASQKANDDGVIPCHTSFCMKNFFLAAGDILECYVYQNSGGALNIVSGIFGKPNYNMAIARSQVLGAT